MLLLFSKKTLLNKSFFSPIFFKGLSLTRRTIPHELFFFVLQSAHVCVTMLSWALPSTPKIEPYPLKQYSAEVKIASYLVCLFNESCTPEPKPNNQTCCCRAVVQHSFVFTCKTSRMDTLHHIVFKMDREDVCSAAALCR